MTLLTTHLQIIIIQAYHLVYKFWFMNLVYKLVFCSHMHQNQSCHFEKF